MRRVRFTQDQGETGLFCDGDDGANGGDGGPTAAKALGWDRSCPALMEDAAGGLQHLLFRTTKEDFLPRSAMPGPDISEPVPI